MRRGDLVVTTAATRRQAFKLGDGLQKSQLDHAGGPIALLGNDDFRNAGFFAGLCGLGLGAHIVMQWKWRNPSYSLRRVQVRSLEFM